MNEPLNEMSSLATFETVAIDRFQTRPQARTVLDEEGLRPLARSLLQEGQLEPILAYLNDHGLYQVIAGHRRLEAARLASISTLKALVFPSKPTEAEILRVQVVENSIREALNPMDLAFAYQKLMTLEGINASQLAERLHVAPSTITRAQELTTLREDLQGEIRTGSLKPAHARELAKVKDLAKQQELRAAIKDRNLSATQTAALVAKAIKPKKPGRPKTNEHKTWKFGGFEATYQPGKKLVLVPTGAGKPKTPDQLIGALEQLLGKLKEELGRSQASATLSAHGVNASEVFQTHH